LQEACNKTGFVKVYFRALNKALTYVSKVGLDLENDKGSFEYAQPVA
jgi:hypothetical protein